MMLGVWVLTEMLMRQGLAMKMHSLDDLEVRSAQMIEPATSYEQFMGNLGEQMKTVIGALKGPVNTSLNASQIGDAHEHANLNLSQFFEEFKTTDVDHVFNNSKLEANELNEAEVFKSQIEALKNDPVFERLIMKDIPRLAADLQSTFSLENLVS